MEQGIRNMKGITENGSPAEIGNIGMWNFDTFRVEEDILFHEL